MKKLFSLLIIGQLLFSLLFLTTIIPDMACAPQVLPTVSIALQEPSQTAHVGPGDTGVVTFNGVVEVICNPLTRVVVSLYSEDTWGSSVVSPSSLVFSISGEQSFTVSVQAPLGESCNTCGTVMVTGRWVMYPGTLGGSCNPSGGATGRIDIGQYHKYSFSSPKTNTQTSPGGRVEFELSIKNEGNGDDTVNLGVNNADELTTNGLHVTFSTTTLAIPLGENMYVNIFVSTYSTTTGGTHEIKIEIIPEVSPNENAEPWFYSFNVELPYNPNSPSPGDEEPQVPVLPVEPEGEDEEPEKKDKTNEEEERITEITNVETDDTFSTKEIFIIMIIIMVLIALGALAFIGWFGSRINRRSKRRARSIKDYR